MMRAHLRRTSRLAWDSVQQNLGAMHRAVYGLVYHHGPGTSKEMECHTDMSGPWKRLSELRDMGLIYEFGERVCRITGQRAIVWDVTDHILTAAEVAEYRRKLEAEKIARPKPGEPVDYAYLKRRVPELEEEVKKLRQELFEVTRQGQLF